MLIDLSKLSVEEKIKRAKIHLYKRSPFFSFILLHLNLVEVDGEKSKQIFGDKPATMGVDKFGNLYFSKEWVDKLDNEELQAVLSHEVMHVALMHLERGTGKDHEVFNLANDLCVNSTLKQEKFKLPECGMIPEDDHTFSLWGKKIEKINERCSEDLYAELYPLLPKLKAWFASGGGDGAGGSGLTSEEKKEGKRKLSNLDQHIYGGGNGKGTDEQDGQGQTGPFQGDAKARADAIKKILAEAVAVSKSRGNLPAGIERMVEGVLDSKVGWKHKLYKYILDQVVNDFSWSMPSKRTIALGIYTPRPTRENIHLVASVDTSGSIGGEELKDFLSELLAITQSFNSIKIDLIVCDCEIHETYELNQESVEEILKLKLSGGGGTSHMPVIQHILDNIPDARVAIHFTDGYSDIEGIPERFESLPFDNVWVISKHGVAEDHIKNGEVIKLGAGDW